MAFNRRSAKTHSGIWRDLAVRKRRTEVDAQIGIVAELGAEAGVPTPLTARLVELIHEIEEGRRPQSSETLDLLASRMEDSSMAETGIHRSSVRGAELPFRAVQGDGAAGLSLARLYQHARPRVHLPDWLASSRAASPGGTSTPGNNATGS